MAVFLTVLVFSGGAVAAATLSNRDVKAQTIAIVEGSSTAKRLLEPQQVLEKICLNGCVVRLNNSDADEYRLEAGDIVAIEDGYLYYDAPAATSGIATDPAQSPKQAPAGPAAKP